MSAPPTLEVREHDVVVNGTRLRVRDVGDAGAAPVLFLHGIMGHRRDWDVLVDVVGRRRRVVVPDQRGHGRSQWTRTYRVTDMARDAIELIQQLDLGPVPIVGHSMGAMVALTVAARRPDLVERLVAVDIVPDSVATGFVAQLATTFDAMAAASYSTVDEATAEWQAGNPLARPELLRNYVSHALAREPDGRLRWRFDARGLRGFATSGVSAAELWRAIDAVRCPTLVVRGQHSPLTSADQVAAVVERLADGRSTVIADGGHDLGVEQPERVADAVVEFLTDARSTCQVRRPGPTRCP
jgi:pimeloyl-ACP methyl ester carboxylesterase